MRNQWLALPVIFYCLSSLIVCGGDSTRRVDENCANGEDDDGDGLIDCDDVDDCSSSPACPVNEICDNELDDDDDGMIDCDDVDCVGNDACPEICDNALDDDGDGDVDCEDAECGGTPECPGTENCTNSTDDDDDGAIDCLDTDCEGHPACDPIEEICDNDVDDDGDDEVDCEDPDCGGTPECPGTENCTNEVDDDDDGNVDCEDADCIGHESCGPDVEDCGNGVDDDSDGDTDCEDPDCDSDPLCQEICDNGVDDDGDDTIDCGDVDCEGDAACAEDCINSVDDDGDDLIDCMDPSCDFDMGCIELCNGIDDDGDGRVDEYPTDPRIGGDCYDGPVGLGGIGQCDTGVNECFGGEVICLGWVAPLESELCDGLDNDCDGTVPAEEADADCGTTVTPGDPTNLELETEVRDVDVQINLDTTGSMSGELSTLRTSLSTFIVPQVRAVLPTAAFGVSTFDDFPCGTFGGSGDWPFTLHNRITSDVTAVQTAIDSVPMHSGADYPESGIESLYQIATGAGVSWPTGDWTPEDCDDWWPDDEDGDGLINCDDPDCYDSRVCLRWPSEDCFNGSDDDHDDYIDCNDPDCVDDWWCWPSTPYNCGDGDIDTSEQCDDGNTISGDGCSSVCRREPGCGNAYIEGSEECDDDNTLDGDGCSSTCTVERGVCGDGVIGPGEQCDDSGTADGDGCDSECRNEPECGNSSLDAGETCDDGNTLPGDGCDSDCSTTTVGVLPIDCVDGFDIGLGHGTIGGACFRETSIPLVVHITDASSHENTDYLAYGADAHSSIDTMDVLNSIGAHVIGVRTGFGARSGSTTDLLYPMGMVLATNTVVPLCAFDGGAARLAGICGDDECCTGIAGNGVAPSAAGDCPLVFDTEDDGDGLAESVVEAIEAVTRFITYELTVVPRDDTSDGVDATCFVESLSISASTGPGGSCSIEPIGLDTDADGSIDTLMNATPRTRATFHIEVINEDINDVDGDGDITEVCATTGIYGLFLDVAADGRTIVASRRLEVEIP